MRWRNDRRHSLSRLVVGLFGFTLSCFLAGWGDAELVRGCTLTTPACPSSPWQRTGLPGRHPARPAKGIS